MLQATPGRGSPLSLRRLYLRLQASLSLMGFEWSRVKPTRQYWQCRPMVLSRQAVQTPPLRLPECR